jgi:acyl dehydratase
MLGTIHPMNYALVGERFGGELLLKTSDIAAFANSIGDYNPIHHDPELAAQTRFGGIIASGPQPAAIFLGLVATYFSRKSAMLGLEFGLKFQKPVFPGQPYRMEWVVAEVEFKEKLKGEIVKLEGQITSAQGEVVLSGTGTVLVTDKL